MSDPPLPTSEQGLALHRRLGSLEALATSDFCLAYAEPLFAWLLNRYPWVPDDHLIRTAIQQTLWSLCKDPTKFNPSLGSLEAYLRRSARADLLNLLRDKGRRRGKEISIEVVEEEELGGNHSGREDDPLVALCRGEDREEVERFLCRARAEWTTTEYQFLELMLEGERRTEAFAVVLGVTDRPAAEREGEVKRVKDRIKVRLKREGLRRE